RPPAPGEPVTVLEGRGRWLTPGFVDAHTHLAWGRFEAADRPAAGSPAGLEQVRRACASTLACGVTAVRDAGGLQTRPAGDAPRLRLSLDIIGAGDARGAQHLRERVRSLVDAGAQWIKVAATGGVGAPPDRVLTPVLSGEEFAAVVATADALGTPVMVHAWGGEAVDWAIRLGVRSIEHGVHLTPGQARAAAAAGVVVVPTVGIYRSVLAMAAAGEIDARDAAAAAAAVAAHPGADRACLDAGVALAMGTDAGTDRQHGSNLAEVAALVGCGLAPATALVAATFTGARLLGLPEPLAPGSDADFVLFDADPALPGVVADRARLVAVVQG
ncbi:MAG: amidohydrolase family protein, partial [Propionicimonas sp.]